MTEEYAQGVWHKVYTAMRARGEHHNSARHAANNAVLKAIGVTYDFTSATRAQAEGRNS